MQVFSTILSVTAVGAMRVLSSWLTDPLHGNVEGLRPYDRLTLQNYWFQNKDKDWFRRLQGPALNEKSGQRATTTNREDWMSHARSRAKAAERVPDESEDEDGFKDDYGNFDRTRPDTFERIGNRRIIDECRAERYWIFTALLHTQWPWEQQAGLSRQATQDRVIALTAHTVYMLKYTRELQREPLFVCIFRTITESINNAFASTDEDGGVRWESWIDRLLAVAGRQDSQFALPSYEDDIPWTLTLADEVYAQAEPRRSMCASAQVMYDQIVRTPGARPLHAQLPVNQKDDASMQKARQWDSDGKKAAAHIVSEEIQLAAMIAVNVRLPHSRARLPFPNNCVQTLVNNMSRNRLRLRSLTDDYQYDPQPDVIVIRTLPVFVDPHTRHLNGPTKGSGLLAKVPGQVPWYERDQTVWMPATALQSMFAVFDDEWEGTSHSHGHQAKFRFSPLSNPSLSDVFHGTHRPARQGIPVPQVGTSATGTVLKVIDITSDSDDPEAQRGM